MPDPQRAIPPETKIEFMSTESFTKAMEFILPHETEFKKGHYGDYDFAITENVPGDSGGLTKFGIDQASHPGVNIAALDKEGALAIYRKEWDSHDLDSLPDKLAIAAFDVWVNGGHANQWLQQSYNATHPNDEPLIEDGVLGAKSYAALAQCDEDAVLAQFLYLRDERFKRLAQKPSRAKFLKGWLQRDDDLEKFLA